MTPPRGVERSSPEYAKYKSGGAFTLEATDREGGSVRVQIGSQRRRDNVQLWLRGSPPDVNVSKG